MHVISCARKILKKFIVQTSFFLNAAQSLSAGPCHDTDVTTTKVELTAKHTRKEGRKVEQTSVRKDPSALDPEHKYPGTVFGGKLNWKRCTGRQAPGADPLTVNLMQPSRAWRDLRFVRHDVVLFLSCFFWHHCSSSLCARATIATGGFSVGPPFFIPPFPGILPVADDLWATALLFVSVLTTNLYIKLSLRWCFRLSSLKL